MGFSSLLQGSNPGLLHCRWILYHLSHQGSPWCPKGVLVNWLKKERKETNSVFVVFADFNDVNTHTVSIYTHTVNMCIYTTHCEYIKQPTWSYWTQIWENTDRIRVNWVTSPGPGGRTGYRVAAITSCLTLTVHTQCKSPHVLNDKAHLPFLSFLNWSVFPPTSPLLFWVSVWCYSSKHTLCITPIDHIFVPVPKWEPLSDGKCVCFILVFLELDFQKVSGILVEWGSSSSGKRANGKVDEACAHLKAEGLLVKKEILGNILKLWKRRKQGASEIERGNRKRQDEQFGREWQEFIWAWKQKLCQGRRGNMENDAPSSKKAETGRGRQRGGSGVRTSGSEELQGFKIQ